MADESMSLPDGKTCGDCAHHRRCVALFGCPPANRECDFYPVRFRPTATPPRETPDDGGAP